ncbi:MAG: hypothetical protein ACOCSQ_00060, partial [Planctomycetota bacterium]
MSTIVQIIIVAGILNSNTAFLRQVFLFWSIYDTGSQSEYQNILSFPGPAQLVVCLSLPRIFHKPQPLIILKPISP